MKYLFLLLGFGVCLGKIYDVYFLCFVNYFVILEVFFYYFFVIVLFLFFFYYIEVINEIGYKLYYV